MAKIGKNVIENLTTAMYENSYIIYREYIQNAADSIDKAISQGILTKEEARIDIDIEYSKHKISIYDNAVGLGKDKFKWTLSNIADSEKDRNEDKGFRGIGRLGGLAYCNKLIFSSSVAGEDVKSIMVWDAKLLREIINDNSKKPSASELVDMVITCKEEKCDRELHFFEVVLDEVMAESNELLDDEKVCEYLEAVAPVPYANSFMYRSKIYEYARNEGLSIDEYHVDVNGNQLFKPYTNKLYEGTLDNKTMYDEVSDLIIKKFVSKSGELLGWMWFAVTKYEKQIPIINKMRGIRIRKENIQVGNEETLSYPKFFKEPRGNFYFIGEIIVVHNQLIPNARRDYFNTNSILREFEEAIKPTFYDEFYKIYHYASRVKSSFKRTVEYEKKKQVFNEKEKNAGFIDAETKESAKKELEVEKEKAIKANRELELRKKDAEVSKVFQRVYKEIENQYNVKEEEKVPEQVINDNENRKNKKYMSQSLSQYSRKEQKLISKVYAIITAILPKDMSEMVVAKIQEELSK
ncbi:ATP-binding protein [Clostridium sp. C2-6-12]|uniref:ATP-binding protein n=1 Tax=Clostridium sp. C2-6-12 TaxID=2698832 RepID=UPI00136BDE52|nr:ATP-binding protein [Clostridium sp. C2-6-12]